MTTDRQPLRSFLFAPGNHARRVEKALSLDADAVIFDLEDAVAVAEKTGGAPVGGRGSGAAVSRLVLDVRVNAADTDFCYADLVAVVRPGLDGVILPKVESPAMLATIEWLVGQLERENDLPQGAADLIPIIETARGARPASRNSRQRRAGCGGSRLAPAISPSTST